MTVPGMILLVEDDPNDADLMLRALRKGEVASRVVHIADGEQALVYLLGNGEPPAPLPAVVLLDWKLPNVSGLEVLRRIRAESRTRRLPVVVLTSSREERDVADAYDSGASSYVRKPVDLASFEKLARDVGVYWLVHNEVLRG
jgi:two-component system response regulator